MSFVATDPPSGEGKTNTWLTPLWIVRELGTFDLDPCGFPGHATANKLICLPEDGLAQPWEGRVWLNPPYADHTQRWLKRLQEHDNGIALIFARMDTKWIRPFLRNGFFAMEGRISFLTEELKTRGNAGAGSLLIPFGRKNIGAILSSNIKGEWYQ